MRRLKGFKNFRPRHELIGYIKRSKSNKKFLVVYKKNRLIGVIILHDLIVALNSPSSRAKIIKSIDRKYSLVPRSDYVEKKK